MRKQKGFSLIELLIVVAIILIIAAIAIPNLLRSRMAANEASAANALRTLVTADAIYYSTYGVGFAGSLGQLGPPSSGTPNSVNADLIDSTLANGMGSSSTSSVKSGYIFTYKGVSTSESITTPNTTFGIVAAPAASGSTGQSTFCTDQTEVILKDPTGGTPTAASTGCTASGTLLPM